MKKCVREAGLEGVIEIDSAGTIDFHAGHPADSRMVHAAKARGFLLTSRARGITRQDFEDFDHILCMDADNEDALRRMAPTPALFGKVKNLTRYCRNRSDTCVPDPYYGGQQGFENVLDIVEDACQGLLEYLKVAYRLGG